MAITMGDHTKVSAPVIDLDQTEHIYDNRYKLSCAVFLGAGKMGVTIGRGLFY
jgi:hypothetical protein